MMKKPFLLLIFVGSVGLGWVGHQGVSAMSPQSAAQPSQSRHSERKTNSKRPHDTHEKEMRAFARQFPLLDYHEQETFSEKLAPSDRGALLEAMLKEGSPSGFKHEQCCLLYSVLSIWVAEDGDGAWAWCQQLTPEASRRFMTGEVLDELAKKDLNKALALHLKLHATDPKFNSDVPLIALEATTTKSARDFLEVLNKIPLRGGGTRNFSFAKDFDFQQAADGVTALLARQHALPDEFPMNFIKSWAERDPDAALAWTKPENQRGGNSFQYLLEGIENQGIPGAASAWVARKIVESEGTRRLIINGMIGASAANIDGVVKALPDQDHSDRFLTELFAEQTRETPGIYYTALQAMSSPQVRLEAFAQAKKDGVNLAKHITESEYKSWGITKPQFDAIFPPTTGN
jgi:hypothetical protein